MREGENKTAGKDVAEEQRLGDVSEEKSERKTGIRYWVKKHWKMVFGCGVVGATFVYAILKFSNAKAGDECKLPEMANDFGNAVQDTLSKDSVPKPGEKYWNRKTENWEKDGKPYTYLVTWKNWDDGKEYSRIFTDVDAGYEFYEWAKKHGPYYKVGWKHVAPDTEVVIDE